MLAGMATGMGMVEEASRRVLTSRVPWEFFARLTASKLRSRPGRGCSRGLQVSGSGKMIASR